MTEALELLNRPVSLQGSRLARGLLRLFGWTLVFDGLPSKQGVLIVYPHTSNWDFVLGIMTKWAVGIALVFWGKDSLFKLPLLGAWMRWLGGIPVKREGPQGAVVDMQQRMQRARETGQFFWLALSPEGTRALTQAWRSGFYQVATAAAVPVGLVFLDYGRRRVGVECFLQLSGEPTADMAAIARRYEGVQACKPALAAPIQLNRA